MDPFQRFSWGLRVLMEQKRETSFQEKILLLAAKFPDMTLTDALWQIDNDVADLSAELGVIDRDSLPILHSLMRAVRKGVA